MSTAEGLTYTDLGGVLVQQDPVCVELTSTVGCHFQQLVEIFAPAFSCSEANSLSKIGPH
jgi:hypothetical protein